MKPILRACAITVLPLASLAPAFAQVTTNVPEPVPGALLVSVRHIRVHAPTI